MTSCMATKAKKTLRGPLGGCMGGAPFLKATGVVRVGFPEGLTGASNQGGRFFLPILKKTPQVSKTNTVATKKAQTAAKNSPVSGKVSVN